MSVLDHLIEEHRTATQLIEQLLDSEEGPDRESTLDQLEQALRTHMAVEEEFIYPIVELVCGSEQEQGAETEHALVRDGLEQMRKLVDAPGFGAAVEMLKSGIAHHVDEEEREIFPKLREEAAEEIDALGDPESLEAEATSRTASGGSLRPGGGSTGSGDETKSELYERAKAADVPGRSSTSKDELSDAVGDE